MPGGCLSTKKASPKEVETVLSGIGFSQAPALAEVRIQQPAADRFEHCYGRHHRACEANGAHGVSQRAPAAACAARHEVENIDINEKKTGTPQYVRGGVLQDCVIRQIRWNIV